MQTKDVQIINKNGKPEWVVLPYEDYLNLLEQQEMLQDIQDYDRIKAELESGEEETVPSAVVYALLDGDNPIRVWRQHRQLTLHQVAEAAGISAPYLSQLEKGKRSPSTGVLAAIARRLNVTMDDLV